MRLVVLFGIGVAFVVFPARPETLSTDASPCGGDAYSSAQVIEGRPPRRGPIVSVPDTLCADLAPRRTDPTRIEIYGGPGGGLSDDGANGTAAPYDGRRQRAGTPSGRSPRRGE